jgi:hypothetical protein
MSNLRKLRAAFLGAVMTVEFAALVGGRRISCGIAANVGGHVRATNTKLER